jgi:mono/diheme cytochrome c family protein
MKDPAVTCRIRLLLCVAAFGGAALSTPAALAQEPDKAKIAAGEQTFSDYCATCHGDNLINTGQSTFDLRRLKATDRARFENSVTNGKNQMPPWKGVLKPEQIDGLWSYVRANAFEK